MQLSLLDIPRPTPTVESVTHLLWRAAGSPTDTTGKDRVVDSYRCTEPCWWCGRPSPGWARPRSVLPPTFPWPGQAAAPDSPHLCLPCGWTLCDRVRLPASYARERLQGKLEKGGRQVCSVQGGELQRHVLLALDDGTVGVWEPGANAAAEEPWKAAVAELRKEPRTVEGVRFVKRVGPDEIDLGPVEKFRAYHHFAHEGRWWPCTDSHRAEIRAWLLDPPPGPWCGVIGDGKKHHAVAAQLLDAVATDGLPCVYHRGDVVYYDPADLARQIEAVEELVRAGADDAEVLTGRYRGRGSLEWLRAFRDHEPVIEPIRGSGTLDLCMYLRRNKKELSC